MKKLSTTSEDILTCARTLIVSGGYNGFSYADIADVVGIRKASIHHHFPSKSDLVRTLVVQHRESLKEGLARLEHALPNVVDQLQAYVRHWQTCIENASAPFCICALLAAEMPILPDEVAQEVQAYFRALSSWLVGVLERGVQQDMMVLTNHPRVEAEAFMACVHGAMLSARAYGDGKIFATIMEAQLDRLMKQQRAIQA